MKLVIGNKNYSSWSLRPWYLLTAFGIEFEEIRIPLFEENMDRNIRSYSNAGLVPILLDGELKVWDSLAIAEYVSEKYLQGRGWPVDMTKRAQARACAAEMHSGFFSIRGMMPMNCRAENRRLESTAVLEQEIKRIDELWSGFRQENAAAGEWLFGEFSIVDCMFAPVAFRFNTYGIELSSTAAAYQRSLLSHPAALSWLAQSREEAETIAESEVGLQD